MHCNEKNATFISMPTILREQGFRFLLYLNDHLPMHVHVSKGGAEAKVLLEPAIEVTKNSGFRSQESGALQQL